MAQGGARLGTRQDAGHRVPPGLPGLSADRPLIDRSGAVSRLAGVLRDRIVGGRLPPGTQLGEHVVAGALGVSRNTLREAFRLLAHEGLVVHEPHRGVFVRTPVAADVRDIYTTRRLVECAAVRHGGEGASAAMRTAVDEVRAAVAEQRWTDAGAADLRFHAAIVALAGSRRLNDMIRCVLAELRLVFHGAAGPRHLHAPCPHRNAEIVTLIEQGRTTAAAEALAVHLDDTERRLLDDLAHRPRPS